MRLTPSVLSIVQSIYVHAVKFPDGAEVGGGIRAARAQAKRRRSYQNRDRPCHYFLAQHSPVLPRDVVFQGDGVKTSAGPRLPPTPTIALTPWSFVIGQANITAERQLRCTVSRLTPSTVGRPP